MKKDAAVAAPITPPAMSRAVPTPADRLRSSRRRSRSAHAGRSAACQHLDELAVAPPLSPSRRSLRSPSRLRGPDHQQAARGQGGRRDGDPRDTQRRRPRRWLPGSLRARSGRRARGLGHRGRGRPWRRSLAARWQLRTA